MVRVSGKIRRLLVDAGLVSDEDWAAARERGGQPLATLLSQGALTETALLATLGSAAGVAPVDMSRMRPDPNALALIPQDMCLEHGILPLAKNDDILTIVISDPFDVLLLDDLKRLTRCSVRTVLSHPAAIKTASDTLFDTGSRQVDDLLGSVSGNEVEVAVEQEQENIEAAAVSSEDAPAVKLMNLIILRGLKEKASDIHIEPGESAMRVRYRVDGAMYEALRPPTTIGPALLSRLKIMSSLDIAERFAPQDGKFQIRFENRKIDFRLSILPVVGGEKAVMRILDTGSMSLKLDSLGYEQKTLDDIKRASNAAYGMLLLTGPTGSGKSTTLYSCIKEVATPDVNVVTVEDPVEYRMDGINQVPVNPKRGMTFAGALRSILRQDPDIVLVGEIRDTETADIAVKAALTGHLVLSTLHTNDAATTITRLVDMGIDPFMVSSSLLCIGAQRLARKLCLHCRIKLEALPKDELLSVGYLEPEIEALEIWGPNPEGCQRCKDGYKGRFAILETLYLEGELKRMVVERRSAMEIKTAAMRLGMLTLRRVGLLNVARGKTSLEEVLRTTLDDK
ncbi:MAG: Flp pilus assembly complex ATPase component TadA [Planctomycetes bacterium]|nr:Flp pilus assembly complex ATPase component TadA [Planctomycetota bacterium]